MQKVQTVQKVQKMCRVCSTIFPDFDVEHTEQFCPFRNSWYCSYCACYGHLTTACPAQQDQPRLLRISQNDIIIAKYLMERSIKIPKGYTKKQVLEEYAKQTNQRIIYEMDGN